jgi:hypothetical protein
MESHRRPAGPRHLLPAEVELCQFIGIDEKDYWEFVDSAAKYVADRPKEYAIVPDIRNEVGTVSLVLTVVGIALQVAGALLAPKPRGPEQQKDPPQLQTASNTQQQRFTPVNNFGSIQELATLGETIPLVYTRYAAPFGGVRVNAKLLWSRLQSIGGGQQLKALYLLSEGILGAAPDFKGLAVGDVLLDNYNIRKIRAYFKDGSERNNRVLGNDEYEEGKLKPRPASGEDVYEVALPNELRKLDRVTCGTRTPSSQTIFGVYSPVPNGVRFKLPYELILTGNDVKDPAKTDNARKREKIADEYWNGAIVTNYASNVVTYIIYGNLYPTDEHQPWGTADVRQATNGNKIAADEALIVGEQYMVGDNLAICTAGADELWGIDDNIESPDVNTVDNKRYKFQYLETEDISRNPIDIPTRSDGPNYQVTTEPYANRTILRAAVATISNNRECDLTEIGIRSTVYKQITSFANLNSHPDQQTIEDYEKENGQITLGQMSLYVNRLSFFELYARKVNTDTKFFRISRRPFAVRGRTPTPQYNQIRVVHPDRAQYEFELRPIAGNVMYRNYVVTGQQVDLLLPTGSGSEEDSPTTQMYSSRGTWRIIFNGRPQTLNPSFCSNPEWVIGQPPRATNDGRVEGLSKYTQGDIPKIGWEETERRYDVENDDPDGYIVTNGIIGTPEYGYRFYWEGEYLGSDQADGREDLVLFDKNDRDVRWRPGSKKVDVPGTEIYEIKREVYSNNDGAPDRTNVTVPLKTSSSGSGLRIVADIWNDTAARWRIADRGRGYSNKDQVTLQLKELDRALSPEQVSLQVDVSLAENSENPYDAIADNWQYDAENPSHANQPEHEVAYVNEVVIPAATSEVPRYDNLALLGLIINASTETTNFSNFSAFVKQGIKVDRLVRDNYNKISAGALNASTNLFPEVAYDLLTSTTHGAGKVIGDYQVDRDKMQDAARFCGQNKLFFDGAITESQNLRQYISNMAAFYLLDFTIIGGKFSLYPSVPFNSSDYKIVHNYKPSIKALFTDGNVRNLKVSFLSPEERQLFRATVLYRQTVDNGFPETRTYSARFTDSQGGSDTDPEERFDMTAFCTSRVMAQTFAKYALMIRKYVDHSITFETTPQAAMRLTPGDYFKFNSHTTHTSRFDTGTIGDQGVIQSFGDIRDGDRILYWKAGMTSPQEATIRISNGVATNTALHNTLFTKINSTTTPRVYKCESISYADDGLVEVSGIHMDLDSSGRIRYLQWSKDGIFDEETL